MTARLTLICHGSTDAVRAAAFPQDEPLDHHGKTGAAELVGSLPNVDCCWTSPELRTRQTAEALGLSADIQPMLRECDYGRWAGKKFSEIVADEPDAANSWRLARQDRVSQAEAGKPRSRADWAECRDPGRYRLRAIGLDSTRDLLPGQWRWPKRGRYRAASNGWTHLVGDGERRVRNLHAERVRGFQMMTSSDFVGCQTGILTGFSPFRILPGHRKCVASDQQRNSAN